MVDRIKVSGFGDRGYQSARDGNISCACSESPRAEENIQLRRAAFGSAEGESDRGGFSNSDTPATEPHIPLR